jgi:hypothetical protein
VLQNVSSCPQSLHHGFFNLCCPLTLIPSSRRYGDTGVLSLAPLKRLAQIAWVMPSEPRPQPPCAESLPAQVKEGLSVATVVEESDAPPPPVIEVEGSGAPPPPATAAALEEGQAAVETAAPLPKRYQSHQPGLA